MFMYEVKNLSPITVASVTDLAKLCPAESMMERQKDGRRTVG